MLLMLAMTVGLSTWMPPQSPPAAPAAGPEWRWTNSRPRLVDVDGDGHEDLVGRIQRRGTHEQQLVAVSVSSHAILWEVALPDEIGSDPAIWVDPVTRLVLLGRGASLTAYRLGTGDERWSRKLSDAIEQVRSTGTRLWVWTADEHTKMLDPSVGDTVAADDPSAKPKRLISDGPRRSVRIFDVKPDEFPGVRIKAGFCPEANAGFPRLQAAMCTFPHGLAYAIRSPGTAVPFLLGYDPERRTERWRMRLLPPETVESMHDDRVLAELFGDEAIVSFVSNDDHLHVVRLSLLDGTPRWEASFPPIDDHAPRAYGLVVGEEQVFVVSDGMVHPFDLSTGEAGPTIGGT